MVSPGDTVTLYGHLFHSGCDDTPACGDEERPLPSVSLRVSLPGGVVRHLGPFAPDGSDFGFSTQLTIPPDTPPGRVRIRHDGQPLQQRPALLVVRASEGLEPGPPQ